MKECIVLAGGLGSRLGDIASNTPKCMVEIARKPFLSYLFDYLLNEKFEHVILSLGNKSDIVIEWINSNKFSFDLSYIIEDKPLGTGGALKKALSESRSNSPFVFNGDTLFLVNTDNLEALHLKQSADITIALKPMTDFDRYGYVTQDESNRIVEFYEKSPQKEGVINGGVYIINKEVLLNIEKDIFSFEKDILEAKTSNLAIYGYQEDSYFMDIGTPDDYKKANDDFPNLLKG